MNGDSGSDNGQFHFTLSRRTDRNGHVFLFAGIRFLNAVLFIRPEPREAGPDADRWQAVLKPFVSQSEICKTDFEWPDDPATDSKPTDQRKKR